MKLKPITERNRTHKKRLRRERITNERRNRTRELELTNIWSAFSYNGPRTVFHVGAR